MRKILIVSSLMVMLIFLIACAPQLTDDQLEAELAKLTPEQREQLLKDLESKNKAFAGQAIRQKYGVSSEVLSAPLAQVKKVTNKFSTEAFTPEDKAALFCNKPENADKKVQYCSEWGNNIKYDRFRCVKYPKKNYPIHEIDTTYKKDLLYPEVDSCPEILGTFLNKPEYATIGCFDSDGSVAEPSKSGWTSTPESQEGYVEIIQLQTGNKAPGASSAAANPVKEVDACSGRKITTGAKAGAGVITSGCDVGYHLDLNQDEVFPPPGYTDPNTPCYYTLYNNKGDGTTVNYAYYGKYLYERKCPVLFESPAAEQTTEIFNCGYETGNNCFKGRCDGNIPADDYLNKDCKGNEWCKTFGPARVKLS